MTNSNLASIAVTQENLSHFNKRLQKAIKSSLGLDVSLSKASEIFAKTCGKDSIHEIQVILKQQQEVKPSLTDFMCSAIKSGALDGMVNEIEVSFNNPEIQTIAEANLERYLNIIKDSVVRSKHIMGMLMEKSEQETYLHFYYKEKSGKIVQITKPFMSSNFETLKTENVSLFNDDEISRQNDIFTMNDLCAIFWSENTPNLNALFKSKVEEYFFNDSDSNQCCIYWNSNLNTLVKNNKDFSIERYIHNGNQFGNYESVLTSLLINKTNAKKLEIEIVHLTHKEVITQSIPGVFKDNKIVFNEQLNTETAEEYIARKTGFTKVLRNIKPLFNQFS